MAYDELKKMKARAAGLSEADAAKQDLKGAEEGDDTGLVDMKLPKPKKGKDKNYPEPCCGIGDDSRYPYGLQLRLEEEQIAKLGLDLPDAGTEMQIDAVGVISDTSERQTQDDGTKRTLTIQITKLKVS